MEMTEMIKLNNERREQLTRENEEYYGDMLVYLRTSNVSQRQAEELALELLEHLITAQKNGRSAEEVFGEDPKGYCKELVGSLPKNTIKTKIMRYIYMAVIFLTWMLMVNAVFGLTLPYLFDVTSPPMISPVIVIYLVLAIGFIEMVLTGMKKSTFGGKAKIIKFSFLLGAGGALYVAVFVWSLVHLQGLQLTFSPWIALLLACVGFVTYKFGMKNIEI